MSIRENINHINQLKAEAAARSGRSGDDVLLVAVTKLHSADEINEAIDCGITDIGENKVQEIMDKFDHVKPVRWHLIGHLQTIKFCFMGVADCCDRDSCVFEFFQNAETNCANAIKDNRPALDFIFIVAGYDFI